MARNEQVFLEAGRITQETGLIAQDIFVVCYFDRAGAEITTYLLKEPNFVDDLQSYQ